MADHDIAYVHAELDKSIALMTALRGDAGLLATVGAVARECESALRRGNKLLFAGNGGSAADAQHLAAEFVSRFNYDRPGLAAFALTTDTSALTAIGNDYGFERLFARQVQAVGVRGDVLFAISTSGRSPNILAALSEARRVGLVTIGMTGATGTEMAAHCNHVLRSPSTETPKIQEGHITLGHIVCGMVERLMFPPS